MKKILIIGGGAMGSAFSVPCLENNNKVTITEPYNKIFIKNLSSKQKFHPSLKLYLPKKLQYGKYSKDIFVTAETGCKYFEEISFPDKILAGLKIDHIGNSSIKYNIGLFKNDNINISAQGLFVHVLINKDTNKPTSIPLKLKDDLKSYA